MDRKRTEKAIVDKDALNKILEPFSRSFLIRQIWDEDPSHSKRSIISVRFKKGNWTKLELMRINLMLDHLREQILGFKKFSGMPGGFCIINEIMNTK